MTSTSPAAARTASVSTRLGTLHVRTFGSGRPTVMWPSMFVDSHTWDLLAPHLESGRRYVLVDGPGLGVSEPLRRTSNIAEAADAAVDLLDGLAINEPVDWVGNAFGGHVGFKLATRPGVLRSLVAISAPTEPITPALRRRILLLRPLLRAFGPMGPVRSAIVDAMLTEASQRDSRIQQIVLDSINRPDRASMTYALSSFILNRVDVNDELADICVPSLFVASNDRGDWSPEDAARAAARTPDAQVTTIADARTLVPLEQPEAVAAELRMFWDRLPVR
jgi:pimeloyl-ACP methyl ester carboxylesterase